MLILNILWHKQLIVYALAFFDLKKYTYEADLVLRLRSVLS